MGSTSSKNVANIVNDATAEVIMQHMQSCVSNTAQTQVISGVSFGFGINQTATANVDLTCMSNFQMTTDIATDIANNIVQKAEAQNIALLDTLRSSRSENITNITNRVQSHVTASVVQTAMAGLSQSQLIANSTVLIGASQTLSASVVQKAISDSVSKTALATSIDNDTSQTAKSTSTNPLSFLTDFGWMVVVLIAVIIIACLGGLYIFLD